jgi:hypothetical protein
MPKVIWLKLDFDLYNEWFCPLSFMDDEESFMTLRKHCTFSLLSSSSLNASKDVRSNLVRDAYHELKVAGTAFSFMGGKQYISRRENSHTITGVENLIAYQTDNEEQLSSAPSIVIPWRRVVVSSAKGTALRCGINAGDVITHVDGEEFDGNSEKLKLILTRKQREQEQRQEHDQEEQKSAVVVQLIVNAEVGVAEALRLRNIVAENQMD